MKPIARFVTRPTGAKGDGEPDLLLGAAFRGQTVLKSGTIYEIRDVLGEATLHEVGPAAIGFTGKTSMIGVSWMDDASHILSCGDSRHILTVAEQAEQIAKYAKPE